MLAGRAGECAAADLRDFLVEHKQATARSEGLVFGRSAEIPFDSRALSRRAATAWKAVEPISLHECRHTFASLMIAAGVNAKALSSYMGHSYLPARLTSSTTRNTEANRFWTERSRAEWSVKRKREGVI
jgi:integrase